MKENNSYLEAEVQAGLNTALRLTKATIDGALRWSRLNNRPYVTYSAEFEGRTYRLQRNMVTESLALFASQVGTAVADRLPRVNALGGLLAAIVAERKATKSTDGSLPIKKRKIVKRGPATRSARWDSDDAVTEEEDEESAV